MKLPIFNIHDLILVLTFAVCLLLAVFQIILSKQKEIASRLLTTFFTCVGLSALANLLVWNDNLHITSPAIKLISAYGLVLTDVGRSVFLYLYVVAITRKHFTLSRLDALHGISALIPLSLLLIAGLDSDQLRFIAHDQSHFSVMAANSLWHYLKLIQVIYALSAVVVIYRYKKQLKEFYSELSLEGPQWLMLLTAGFALNWCWSLIVHFLGQSVGINLADSLGIFDNYITFLLVNAVFVYSLLYAHQLIETKAPAKEKEVAPTLETAPNLIDRIKNGMEVDQLYLRQNLNIEEFAKHVGIHYREVSSIINKHFDTNFFEFVNLYRVNKVKEMLVDPQFAETTILDILMEAGFNSKSSFHRFFKRYTGMSAAEYRKLHATKHVDD